MNDKIIKELEKHNLNMLLFGFVAGKTQDGKNSIPVAIRQFKSKFNINIKQNTLERKYYATASEYISKPL